MVIAMPRCDFKCNIEAKEYVYHNYKLRNNKLKCIDKYNLISRYLDNSYTKAIAFVGLEPMDNTPYDVNTNIDVSL